MLRSILNYKKVAELYLRKLFMNFLQHTWFVQVFFSKQRIYKYYFKYRIKKQ